MGRKKVLKFKCHNISGGSGQGQVLISKDNLSFYHADPKTGEITEENHDLKGQSIAGKVLVFPAGKGSSVVQGEGLHQLTKHGMAPKALIIQYPDTVLVVGAVIWRVPLVDRVEEGFYKKVRNGSFVEVNADKGVIALIEGGDLTVCPPREGGVTSRRALGLSGSQAVKGKEHRKPSAGGIKGR